MPGRPARPIEVRFWEKVERGPDCWLWRGTIKDRRYGVIGLPVKGFRYAHRLSYELHFGPIPPGLSVLHRCDNPPCVRPDHLFLGTQRDNLADMRAKGREAGPGTRVNFGEQNGRAVLDWPKVIRIRQRHANGEQIKTIARDLGVGQTTIANIVHRRRWRECLPVRQVRRRSREGVRS